MSLALARSRDLEVKTRSGIAATAAGPFHTFEIYGNDPGQDYPLHIALDAIEAIVTDPVHEADPVLSGLRRYLTSLKVENEEVRGQHIEYLEPTDEGYMALQQADHAAAGGEPVTFLDHQVDRQDFVAMTHYVMTNTALHPEMPIEGAIDSRLPMIESLRSKV